MLYLWLNVRISSDFLQISLSVYPYIAMQKSVYRGDNIRTFARLLQILLSVHAFASLLAVIAAGLDVYTVRAGPGFIWIRLPRVASVNC